MFHILGEVGQLSRKKQPIKTHSSNFLSTKTHTQGTRCIHLKNKNTDRRHFWFPLVSCVDLKDKFLVFTDIRVFTIASSRQVTKDITKTCFPKSRKTVPITWWVCSMRFSSSSMPVSSEIRNMLYSSVFLFWAHQWNQNTCGRYTREENKSKTVTHNQCKQTNGLILNFNRVSMKFLNAEGRNRGFDPSLRKISMKSSLACWELEYALKNGWNFWDLRLFPCLKTLREF